ncbi:MAG: putative CocE/NonD family hydrolase, partial [Halioglobus sp.]
WKEKTPDVKYWVYGKEQFREDTTWPPSAINGKKSLYLSAGPTGSISSLNDGRLVAEKPSGAQQTEFSYPDLNWKLGNVTFGKFGPDAQRFNLTFTSDVLADDFEVVGIPTLELYLSSSQIDTDVIVKLQEQSPLDEASVCRGKQPESAIVAKGWLKASHRAIDDVMSEKLGRTMYSHERPKLLNPGQVYKLEICLTGCAHLLRKGNRIRLDVSNADSGLTDGQFASIYHWEKVGTDTYYHSQACPSRLILPKI